MTTMLRGRDDVLATAEAVIAASLAGDGEPLVFVGQPGIGATRLLRELLERHAARGVTIAHATSPQTDQPLPYGGLAELVHGLSSASPRLAPQRRAAIEAAIGVAVGVATGRVADRDHEGPGSLLAVAVATRDLLDAAAGEAGLLVVLDDVQWLDPNSAEVLAFALRSLDGRPISVLAATTSPDAPPWLPAARFLHLDPLDAATVRDLLLGHAPDVAATAREAIVSAAEGNPLAAIEMLRDLTADERHGRVPIRRALGGRGRLGRLFAHRVGELPESCRTALVPAAVSGHSSLLVLQEAWRRLGAGLDDVAPAELAGLVHVDDGVTFTHPMVRTAVLAAAPAAVRRRAHAALAEALPADARGPHLAASVVGRSDLVASALDRHAAAMRRRGAYLAAAESSVEAARRGTSVSDAAIRLLAGSESAARGGDGRRSLSILETPIDHAAVPPPAITWLAVALAGARLEAGLVTGAGEALELLAGVDTGPDRALVHAMRSQIAHASGDGRLMVAEAEAAETALDGGASSLTRSQVALQAVRAAAVLEQPVRLHRWLDVLAELVAPLLAEMPRLATHALLELAQQGRVELALDVVPPLVERQTASGEWSAVPLLHAVMALAHLERCEWDDAEREAAAAIAMADEAGIASTVVVAAVVGAQVAALRGDQERCRVLLERRESSMTGPGRGLDTSVAALAAVSAGDPTTAARFHAPLWDRVLEGRITSWSPMRAVLLSDAVEVFLAVGDTHRATAVAAEYRRRAELGGHPLVLAEAHRTAGHLAGVDHDDALAHFDAALQAEQRWPNPFVRARILLSAGQALRRSGRTTLARDRLDESVRLFERLGARGFAGRAEHERRTAGGRRRGSPGDGRLTDRELAVAKLMRAGRTNAEIAALLFVSVKTVETHASRVLAKLGVRNRTELAGIDLAGSAPDGTTTA